MSTSTASPTTLTPLNVALSTAAAWIDARLQGADAMIRAVSTDTRSLTGGELFVALSGEHFDGHDYIEQARERGAAAAMVSRAVTTDLPLLQVDDTRLALGRLGRAWRVECALPIVGITGSNGKTTVKEMVAAILRERGAVHATRGNLNNDIGVPLTLLEMRAEHDYAVIEMGANHGGEIAYLAGLTQPNVGLVTNAGPAHLEGFGSLDGVAHAKGEMFKALPDDGIAVVNADDVYAPLWLDFARPRTVVRFGLDQAAEYTGTWAPAGTGSALHLQTPQGDIDVELALPGRHNVMNALAAAAATASVGAELTQIAAGLAGLRPVPGRLQVHELVSSKRLIDDTYNANPGSLRAALAVLQTYAGARYLVLGDMGELGAEGAALHAQAGEQARAMGVEQVFAIGAHAPRAAQSFGSGGHSFAAMPDLLEALIQTLQQGAASTVLVKGSRSMRMEQVVQGLRKAAADGRLQQGEG